VAAACPIVRDDAGGPADGRDDAAGAGQVLPRLSPRGERPRQARHHLDAARRGAGVPEGGRPRARDPDRVSPRRKAERRRNRPLREVLDELLVHSREIARRAKQMTPTELEYSQQRLEWLADEVWRVATGEAPPE